MALSMKDLAAFAAAERQIQMLDEAPGHAAVEAPEALPTTVEPDHKHVSAKVLDAIGRLADAVADAPDGECDEPWLQVNQTCNGKERILCHRHGRELLGHMLREGIKTITGEEMVECPDCDNPVVECWQPTLLSEGHGS